MALCDPPAMETPEASWVAHIESRLSKVERERDELAKELEQLKLLHRALYLGRAVTIAEGICFDNGFTDGLDLFLFFFGDGTYTARLCRQGPSRYCRHRLCEDWPRLTSALLRRDDVCVHQQLPCFWANATVLPSGTQARIRDTLEDEVYLEGVMLGVPGRPLTVMSMLCALSAAFKGRLPAGKGALYEGVLSGETAEVFVHINTLSGLESDFPNVRPTWLVSRI